MHGSRPEHPAVFTARMQHHKDAKDAKDAKGAKGAKKGDSDNKGPKAPDKDAAQDKRETAKRKAMFQRKASDAAKAEQQKPARGVLTHLLPDQ